MAVAVARLWGMAQADRIDADPRHGVMRHGGRSAAVSALGWDVPTRGTVFATALNYRGALAAIGKGDDEAPSAPLIYVKPANTWIAYGAPIPLPTGTAAIEVGASLAVVIGQTASHIDSERADEYIAGYTIANDVGEPQAGLVEPLRARCRDGYCALGPWVMARQEMPPLETLGLRVLVNGVVRCENGLRNLVRPVPLLLAEVSRFVTLCAGDVLLTGIPEGAPLAGVGDRVRIEIDGVGALENPVAQEDDFVAGARP